MEQVNRVDLTIKREMLEILASMKGKTLKSIEGNYDFNNRTFVELICFNLGQFSTELISVYVPVEWKWGTDHLFQDEATCFSVNKMSSSEKRIYPKGCNVTQLLKNEVISEVMIVRDRIINSDDDILVDSGIVIRTKENVYTFSRCDLSGFWIHMNESDKIDMFYSVKDVRSECSDSEKGLKATVKRDYIFL